jgi:hypothetical protein
MDFFAVSWLRLLVADLSPRRLGFARCSVYVGYVEGKWHWDRIFSGFPCQYHSTVALFSRITCKISNRHVGGCSSETYHHPIYMNMEMKNNG